MSEFGNTLFRGSRFLFRALVPPCLLFGIAMPLMITEWNAGRVTVIIGLEVGVALLCLLLWRPAHSASAGRLLAGLVFTAYLAYFGFEVSAHPSSIWPSGPRSQASAYNALTGLLLIGGPCLLYALFGRFSYRPDDQPEDDDTDVEDEDGAV